MSEAEERKTSQEEPRVMSEDDVNDYHGLTLNEEGQTEDFSQNGEDPHIHIRTIHINELPWWKKGLGLLAVASFILLGAVVAWFFLLYGVLILAAGGIVYFLRKYF